MKMKNYESYLGDFQLLMAKYGLPAEDVARAMEGVRQFQVTVPLVGRFSTGKSSLVNTLLGRKILAENTMPETSIPTEITYGEEDAAVLVKKDLDAGKVTETRPVSMDEVLHGNFSVSEWSALRLTLHDDFLKTVPAVRLVDMPGFGTSIELHNKAINEYLPESKAYILTFEARSSTVEEDTLEFLKELKFHEMPVYVLVTKSNAVSGEELKQCVENLKQQLAQNVGLKNVPIYCTNAKGKQVDVEGFKTVLEDLQRQSTSLREKEEVQDILRFGGQLKTYLVTAITKNSYSASDLEAEKEKQQRNLESLKKNLEKEKSDFQQQIPGCIDSIASDVRIALEDFADEFANLAMDGRQETIKSRINAIIRTKVGEGIKNSFAPRARHYLDRVAATICVEAPDLNPNMEDGSDPAGILTKAGVSEQLIEKGLLTLLSKIGLKIPNPMVKILAAVILLVVNIFSKKSQVAEIKQKVMRHFRTETVPQLADQVMGIVKNLIEEQVDQVNAAIDKGMEIQLASAQKALDDLVKRASDEKAEKEEYLAHLQEDLEAVNGVLSEVGA